MRRRPACAGSGRITAPEYGRSVGDRVAAICRCPLEPAHNARMPTPAPARHDDTVDGGEESPRRVAGTVRLMTEDPFEIDDDAPRVGQRLSSIAAKKPVDHPRRADGDRRGFPGAPPPALTSSPPRGAISTSGGLSGSGEDVEHERLEGEAWLGVHGDRLGGLEDARQDLDDAGEIQVLRPRLERRAVGLPDRELRGARRRSTQRRGRMMPRHRA